MAYGTSFSFDSSPRSRDQYERIPLSEDEKLAERYRWFSKHQTKLVLVGLGAVVLSVLAIWSTREQAHKDGKHLLPTVLSVVSNGEYANALENELYEHLKDSTFDHKLQDTHEPPQIFLDNYEIEPLGPLTLSWTNGRDPHGRPIIKDGDIMVLHCGTESIHRFNSNTLGSSDSQAITIVDAATMAQVRETAQHDHEWHFSSFPVFRYEVCQFLIYSQQPNKLVLLTASDLLHIPHAHSQPTSIHWALSKDDPTAMVVNFVTGDKIKDGEFVSNYNQCVSSLFRFGR